MKIKQTALLQALEYPVKIATRKQTIQILSHLRIEAGGSILKIVGADGVQFVERQCACEGALDAICISAQAFYSIVALAESEFIEMTLIENRLEINNGSALKIPVLPASEFPIADIPDSPAVGVSVLDLSNGVKAVVKFASEDVSRGILRSVHVRLAHKQIFCEASGGKDCAFFIANAISSEGEFCLESEFAEMFSNFLLRENSALHLSENNVVVKSSDGIYSCALTNGKYPDTSAVLASKRTKIGETKPSAWKSKLQLINEVAADGADFTKVEITFLADKATLKVLSKNSRELDGSVPGAFLAQKALKIAARPFQACLESFPSDASVSISVSERNAVIFEHGELTLAMQQLKE
jgi:DNA polymerase III sliding clamp (beta) subunit (PCNA family)